MANRQFQRCQTLEKEIKTLYAEVAIGALGAPTLTAGLGIASVARTATGRYTVTLEDQYVRVMDCTVTYHHTTTADLQTQLTAHSETAKTVSFAMSAAAIDADPASGSILFVKVALKNSTVGE